MKSLYQEISGNRPISQIKEEKKMLQEIILTLPIDQQRVLEMHFTKQLSIKEIAAELKCSISATYNRLHRALFKLKTEFNPQAFERAYRILYPEAGKPITIVSSIVSEYDQENNQSIV